MLSCGAAFSLREANVTEMKTTFTPYDSDDVLTATVNGSGDESKITLSAQDSSNTGARIMRFVTDLADQVGAVIGHAELQTNMKDARLRRRGEAILAARSKRRKTMIWILAAIFPAIVLVAGGIIGAVSMNEEPPLQPGMACMPESSSSFQGEYYEDVVTQIENAGFTNVSTREKKDLITGWINKEGDRVGIREGEDQLFNQRPV